MLGRAALWPHAGGREVRYNPLQRPFAAFAASRETSVLSITPHAEARGRPEEGWENSTFKMTTSTSRPLHRILWVLVWITNRSREAMVPMNTTYSPGEPGQWTVVTITLGVGAGEGASPMSANFSHEDSSG